MAYKFKQGLLFIGGKAPQYSILSDFMCFDRQSMYIIAADSGLETVLSLDFKPDLIVGDMDSLTDQNLLFEFPANIIKRFPRDKDETDTEIGLYFLTQKDCRSILLIGGGEGRLDHSLALLTLFKRKIRPDLWLTAREHIEVIKKEARYAHCMGQTISFFPITQKVIIDWSTGLKWPLKGLTWKQGQFGLSNVAVRDQISIKVKSGELLMVRQLKPV